MRDSEAVPADESGQLISDDERFDENQVERALADLDDDVARTGAACSEDDLNRAADRHGLSILELAELQSQAGARDLVVEPGTGDPLVPAPMRGSRRAETESGSMDPLHLLFEQLQGFPLLDAAEEIALGRAIEAGTRAEKVLGEGADLPRQELERTAEEGLRSRQRMVACNVRLAVANARDFRGQGLDFEDLVQAAMPGLIRAAEKFDHRKGFKFSTYATWWIRQSISRALANTGRMIRLPVHVVERHKKFQATRSRLESELRREPTTEELASRLEWDLAEVTALTEIPTVVSLDAPVGNESDAATLGDFLESDTPSPHEQAIDLLRAQLLHRLLGELPPRQRRVIELRHGLEGQPRTLEEIGRSLGVTRERVRQIEREALRQMREKGTEVGLPG